MAAITIIHGFSMWMAGGGGEGWSEQLGQRMTLASGPNRIRSTCTICMQPCSACLDSNHTKLTYRYAGRDFRLTDVYGEVVKRFIA